MGLILESLAENPDGMTTEELREAVKELFLRRGGVWPGELDERLKSGTPRWVNLVAWGLARLRQEGRFSADLPKGFYRLNDGASPQAATDDPSEGDVEEASEELAIAPYEVLGMAGATVIGDGPETVYAYTYPGLEDRLKIGFATQDPGWRIMKQLGTSSPAWPRVKIIIRCDNAPPLRATCSQLAQRTGPASGGAGP